MIVGLTGGIGSGKTTVARIFAMIGAPVYEADSASKKLIDSDRNLQGKLQAVLGADIVLDGKIDRPKMASLIFSDENLLQKTNEIIHPAVAEDFQNWHQNQNADYVIREAAILFKSGSYQDCDKIIVVSAPQEMRIKRVMQRGNQTREQVLARMKNQWPEAAKLERADFVVKNDQTESLIKQVLRINENLIGGTNAKSGRKNH